jgi:hypothetical protein
MRRLLIGCVVVGFAGVGLVQASATPTSVRVCSLGGTWTSGGAGHGGYSYSLEGAGSCVHPSSPVSLRTVFGGGDISSRLPTCRPQRQLTVPDAVLPTGGDDLLVDLTIASTIVHTRWSLRGPADYISQTALLYQITGDAAGTAVVTARTGTCVYGAPGTSSAPVRIALRLAS